jgi:hypothetical protein
MRGVRPHDIATREARPKWNARGPLGPQTFRIAPKIRREQFERPLRAEAMRRGASTMVRA